MHKGDKVVTSSVIVPGVRVLKNTLTDLSQSYSSRFVSTLKDSVNRRLSPYEEQDAFLLASELEPWFNLSGVQTWNIVIVKVHVILLCL